MEINLEIRVSPTLRFDSQTLAASPKVALNRSAAKVFVSARSNVSRLRLVLSVMGE